MNIAHTVYTFGVVTVSPRVHYIMKQSTTDNNNWEVVKKFSNYADAVCEVVKLRTEQTNKLNHSLNDEKKEQIKKLIVDELQERSSLPIDSILNWSYQLNITKQNLINYLYDLNNDKLIDIVGNKLTNVKLYNPIRIKHLILNRLEDLELSIDKLIKMYNVLDSDINDFTQLIEDIKQKNVQQKEVIKYDSFETLNSNASNDNSVNIEGKNKLVIYTKDGQIIEIQCDNINSIELI